MKDIAFACQEDIPAVPAGCGLWEIPSMGEEVKTLRERLRERIDADPNTTARKISLGIGANVAYVSQILQGRGGMPSAAKLRAMAELLGTTTDYLLGKSTDPRQPQSEVTFGEVQPSWRGHPDDRIPLLGTGYCDDLHVDTEDGEIDIERVQLEIDHVVRLIERPPALWNSRDAYAIYFHGSSMEPRFYQGEVGIVDPSRPPGPGDFVVVQLTEEGSDDVLTVLVKQLVRSSSAFVELAQFNPPLSFRLPRARVKHLHRILSPAQLFGI